MKKPKLDSTEELTGVAALAVVACGVALYGAIEWCRRRSQIT